MVFQVKEGFKFGDGQLNWGDRIVVSQRHVHRNPAVWGEDAHEFRPERFENCRFDPSLKWKLFTFGFGRKQCPGQHFALMETKMTLASLLYDFDIKLDKGGANAPDPLAYHQVFNGRFDNAQTRLIFTPRKAQEHQLQRSMNCGR
jgi:cytochrome P450